MTMHQSTWRLSSVACSSIALQILCVFSRPKAKPKPQGKHDEASEHWKVWNALDLQDEEDKHKVEYRRARTYFCAHTRGVVLT